MTNWQQFLRHSFIFQTFNNFFFALAARRTNQTLVKFLDGIAVPLRTPFAIAIKTIKMKLGIHILQKINFQLKMY